MKVVKKIFKVLSVLIIIVVLCIGLYIGFVLLSSKIRDIKNNNERIYNSKTLSQYINNHSSERLQCAGCGDLGFRLQDFKCDEIKDKEIIYFNHDILVLSDYKIYEVLLSNDKLYSNNQQCKKVDTGDIKIDGLFVAYESAYFKSNDSFYSFMTTAYNNKEFRKIDEFDITKSIIVMITNNHSIIGVDNNNIYYTIKDGNIYKVSLTNYPYEIKSEEIIISKDEYGYIKSADMSRNVDLQITQLITDRGIYTLKKKKDQDCEKYVDVSCEYELVLSDIYSKYSKDIRYMGNRLTILNDNNIIDTTLFFNELDKEVK